MHHIYIYIYIYTHTFNYIGISYLSYICKTCERQQLFFSGPILAAVERAHDTISDSFRSVSSEGTMKKNVQCRRSSTCTIRDVALRVSHGSGLRSLGNSNREGLFFDSTFVVFDILVCFSRFLVRGP